MNEIITTINARTSSDIFADTVKIRRHEYTPDNGWVEPGMSQWWTIGDGITDTSDLCPPRNLAELADNSLLDAQTDRINWDWADERKRRTTRMVEWLSVERSPKALRAAWKKLWKNLIGSRQRCSQKGEWFMVYLTKDQLEEVKEAFASHGVYTKNDPRRAA